MIAKSFGSSLGCKLLSRGDQTVAFLWVEVTVAEPGPHPVLKVTFSEAILSARVDDFDPTASFTVRNAGGVAPCPATQKSRP